MALWPFGKKNESAPDQHMEEQENQYNDVPSQAESGTTAESAGVSAVNDPVADQPDPLHDAITGTTGPYDAGEVDIADFDFSDFSKGTLDLGSLQMPLPKESEVQVEMGDQGPRMLHVVTRYGRLTPVAFAGRTSAGQWREATKEIAEGMRKDGLTVRVEQGPWGREVVGEANDRRIRIAGVDGPRWMLRVTMISPADRAEEMKELGREVIARTFVNRGDAPILAGSPLPVALPQQFAEQIQQAMEQRAQQQQKTGSQSGQQNPQQSAQDMLVQQGKATLEAQQKLQNTQNKPNNPIGNAGNPGNTG